jgi:nitrile hydratase accessory protein
MTKPIPADHPASPSFPGVPRDADGPVFREPWEAQAFALAVALNARGVFGWDEWAAALGEEIRAAQRAGDPDTGATYYHHWLKTLERMIAGKGVADGAALARYRDAWARAAGRTPHGAPIALADTDFAERDLVETDFTETGP